MLIITQKELDLEDVKTAGFDWYGSTFGPITVIVKDGMTVLTIHRLESRYAFMYVGGEVRKPLKHELEEFWNVK